MVQRFLLICFLAALATALPADGDATISITAKQTADTVLVTVTATRTPGCSVAIQVASPWETIPEDPAAPTQRPLDFRGPIPADGATVAPSVAGSWRIVDAADGTRTYTTTLTNAGLRQQFVVVNAGEAAVGAITGGAVGAVVRAYLYRRVITGTSATAQVISKATIRVATAPETATRFADMRASVLRPIVISADGKTARATVETVAYVFGDDAKPAVALAEGSAQKCDTVAIVGDGWTACTTRHAVAVPVTSPSAGTTPVDTVVGLVEQWTSTKFMARFVVPATAICREGDASCSAPRAVQPKEEITPAAVVPQAKDEIATPAPTAETAVNVIVRGVVAAATDGPAVVGRGKRECFDITTANIGAVRIDTVELVDATTGATAHRIVQNGRVVEEYARFLGARLTKLRDGTGYGVCLSVPGEVGQKFHVIVRWSTTGPATARTEATTGAVDLPIVVGRHTGLPMHDHDHEHTETHHENNDHDHDHDGHRRGWSTPLVMGLTVVLVGALFVAIIACVSHGEHPRLD